MTKEEIIELAKQSGAMFDHMTWVERDLFPVFERFAKLVAEKEREECAKISDSYADGLERNYSEIISDKIRARGNND